jgi:hypothetical protein
LGARPRRSAYFDSQFRLPWWFYALGIADCALLILVYVFRADLRSAGVVAAVPLSLLTSGLAVFLFWVAEKRMAEYEERPPGFVGAVFLSVVILVLIGGITYGAATGSFFEG